MYQYQVTRIERVYPTFLGHLPLKITQMCKSPSFYIAILPYIYTGANIQHFPGGVSNDFETD